MNAELTGAAIFVITVIFSAGGIVYTTRKELAQTKLDVNRMGTKIRDLERTASRRHHNISMVMVTMQDSKDDRFRISGLLKED